MGILLVLGTVAVCLVLAGRFYAPVIAKVLGERSERATPATLINDGQDYVPTRTPVVFAHHFASIAGAGPIIGPVLAVIYGWGPALAWIVLGGIFMGAVHDFTTTHISMREGGKSLTVTAQRYIGKAAFVILIILLVAMMVLVCAVFLNATASALKSQVPLADLQLSADQGLFRMDGEMVIVGGIATRSVILITLCSPLIGWMYLKRKTPVWICSLLSVVICAVSVVVGFYWPVTMEPGQWKILISGYVLVSAGLPVWMFLQSRDFINVHLLYVGILFMFVALIAAGLRGGGTFGAVEGIPFNNIQSASEVKGFVWPTMFILIACGAVSGFHSLCASGTTCKQLPTEVGARQVGYYGMLLESFFAACVVGCLLVGLSLVGYQTFCYPGMIGVEGKGNWILTFAVGVGQTAHVGLGLPVWVGVVGAMLLLEGFIVTTLDTAIRLVRYLLEEGWTVCFGRYDVFAEKARAAVVVQGKEEDHEMAGTGGMNLESVPKAQVSGLRPEATSGPLRALLVFLKQYWVNSGIAVGLMLWLGWGQGYQALWPIFGAANQLLAAMALLIATTWLMKKGRVIWFTLIPAVFMLTTSVTALVRSLAVDYLPSEKVKLAVTAGLILVLTGGVLITMVRSWMDARAAAQDAQLQRG